MTDYEPRERTPEWERLIDLHERASDHARGWFDRLLGFNELPTNVEFESHPTRLYRDGICVAAWRSL